MIIYWSYYDNYNLSLILFIFLTKLSKINSCMAQCAILILMFLYLTFIHFVFAAFTTIIISSYNRFTTNNTSWEIASTLSAYCIILSNKALAMTSWTFYSLSRGLFWRMLRENAYSNINISLSFFMSPHSLKLDKSTRAFFITLKLNKANTLL